MAGWTNGRDAAGGYIERHKAQRILTAHGHVCHVCKHGDAEQVDHITPWAEWDRTMGSPHQPANLAPIHGARCPTCGQQCHKDKTQAEAQRGQQRRIQRGRRPVQPHPGAIG